MKLGTLLLRNAAIGLAQLESALRNQVLYGGKLGTNLVELGFVDLDQLTDYLAELTELPPLTVDDIDRARPDVLALLDGETALELGAVPLRRDGDACVVAMVEPRDRLVRERLHGLVGEISPRVTPELRLQYCVERYYGLARKARFVRIGAVRPDDSPDERRRELPAGGLILPRPITVEPRRRRQTTVPPVVAPIISRALNMAQAEARLDRATHRDQIAQTFVEFARGRFDALVVFIVRDGHALGWRVYVANGAALQAPIEELSLPLGGASALQEASDTGKQVFEFPRTVATPIEQQLWKALGTAVPPVEIVVAPITVRQRVVNLIYAQPSPGQRVARDEAQALLDLAVRAQTAYVRMIRDAKD